MEINISCCGEKAFIDSNLPMWKARIAKWAEQFPESVRILKEPELNDGYVYASIPAGWLKKIKPNRSIRRKNAMPLHKDSEGAPKARRNKHIKLFFMIASFQLRSSRPSLCSDSLPLVV